MELFRADLHIHSRFSRATAKSLNPLSLRAWAGVKGISVLGTGDFTHPEWLAELKEHLEYEDNTGLYRLADDKGTEREIPWSAGAPLSTPVRFMLQAEISSIYKRGGKVRKIHNLVYMPTFEAAEKLNQRLAEIGNLVSDGRPILGLDSQILLEMVLETDPLAYLIPAHIWTPWFSLFGSKSGFDTIEECYGDLSSEIFALETGLSSDPDMNRMLSKLDRFRLVSNSDAHSGEKLARELNLFSGEPSYEGIYRALRGESLGHKFLGTIEFFPEEGKYHLDGHRKCQIVMEPHEALARDNTCPVCGKPMTLGVLHRVQKLADREAPVQPADQPGFISLVPLKEIISEITGTGPNTKKVMEFYTRIISRFGAEVAVLQDTPVEDIKKVSAPLAEGLERMRSGDVIRKPGFDGEFGVISVFTDQEKKEFKHGRSFLGGKEKSAAAKTKKRSRKTSTESEASAPPTPRVLNEDQQKAIAAGPGPVLVQAGPGTGKTHTLTARIGSLLEQGTNPRHIVTVTFTRRAAQQLQNRLAEQLGDKAGLPRADTLHALAFEYWHAAYDQAPVLLSEDAARKSFNQAALSIDDYAPSARELRKVWEYINLQRERMEPAEEYAEQYHRYTKLKESWNLADYTDLLEFWLDKIKNGIYVCPYTHILVDEFQDLSPLQSAVITALAPEDGSGLFAIGDSKQSIYAFRGASGRIRETLKQAYPRLQEMPLTKNYRSSQQILDFSARLFPDAPRLEAIRKEPGAVRFFEAPTDRSEAAWVAERIRLLLGSTAHSLMDEEKDGADSGPGTSETEQELRAELSPGDIAVLVRFKGLMPPLKRSLDRLGLPVSVPEAESFWQEPRVEAILSTAGTTLGIAYGEQNPGFTCPENVILQGPKGFANYLEDMPPFDRLFWKSQQYRKLEAAYEEHSGWVGLLNWIHLQNALEAAGKRSEKVRIMSLHAAKGLEFKAVFLPALEEGILPFAGPELFSDPDEDERRRLEVERGASQENLDEERRLLYVGLTRAERVLYLSRAVKRTLYGRELVAPASRFLEELLAEDMSGLYRSTLVSRTRSSERRLSLL